MLNLYVSETLPADVSLVASADSPIPTMLPKFVFGDAPSVTIRIVDGAGGIASTSGQFQLNVALGIPGEAPISQNAFIQSGTAWLGKLQLNSAALQTLIGDMAVLNCTLQIQLLDVNGQPQTICMAPMKILESVLPVSLSATTLGLITGDDGVIYQLTALVVNGTPTISPVVYGNQNITAPTTVSITGNDSQTYTYVVLLVNDVPTLVNQ